MEDKEFTERYTIHRMAEQEIVAAIECGDEDLNGFILTDAPLYRKEKLAVTYTVFEKSNHNHIVAFFSLHAVALLRPQRFGRRLTSQSKQSKSLITLNSAVL
jgi:hypothetical protein